MIPNNTLWRLGFTKDAYRKKCKLLKLSGDNQGRVLVVRGGRLFFIESKEKYYALSRSSEGRYSYFFDWLWKNKNISIAKEISVTKVSLLITDIKDGYWIDQIVNKGLTEESSRSIEL